jgi:hypothetical protein
LVVLSHERNKEGKIYKNKQRKKNKETKKEMKKKITDLVFGFDI